MGLNGKKWHYGLGKVGWNHNKIGKATKYEFFGSSYGGRRFIDALAQIFLE
jgi:hypothetical protein